MSSDGSFPHKHPAPDPEPVKAEPEGARVLEFPTDEGSAGSAAETWTDGDAAESVERLLRPAGVGDSEPHGNVVAFPGNATTQKRLRVAAQGREPSGKQATAKKPDAPKRPKYLASELLKQDWWPVSPLKRTLRWGALGVGVLGAIAAVGLGGFGVNALGIAALFVVCGAAGIAPLKPQVRGLVLALTGGLGAGWVGYLRAIEHQSLSAPLLVGCATVSASALFFRASHRTSKLARALVAVGLAATLAWLVLTGGVDALIVESLEWQSWVEPTSRILLGLIGLLALLSFLDPTGNGGGWVTGGGFLVWLSLDALGSMALHAWPTRAAHAAMGWADHGWLTSAALPLFCALAAGGLCQVFVMVSRPPKGSTRSVVSGA